jgi:hypothetical protein
MSHPAHEHPDDDRSARHPAQDDEARPEWLVSSDQGAEDERRAAAERHDADQGLRLTTSQDLSTAVPIERPKLPERPEGGAKQSEDHSKGPKTWAAAASSVPKMKVVASASSGTSAMVRPTVDPRARSAAPDFDEKPRVLRAVPPSDLDDESEADGGFPDATGPHAPVAAPPRHLDEPLWVIALDALRSNRKVQLLVALLIVLPLVAWILWPRNEPGVSIHALRREPARWDGQMVRLNGRVGEVFHVGAGWAYNLHQGRDTIVVFTRGARPRTRDKISVAGSVSTGYLDGQPRQAIFAEPESR